MGLLSMLFKLPVAPINGVIAIAEIVRDQVEAETRSPAAIQRDLEALEQEHRAGRVTDEEVAEAERGILNRVIE